VLSRKFNADFSMGLLAKDLSIALQVARETGTASPLSALVRDFVVSAEAKLGPNADHTEMARLSELLAGSELSTGEA
jgi:3-hydroxyisobutyrate dehydrogenase